MENNIVKKTCKELGITQKELAERMGVTENTVGNWARDIIEMPPYATKMIELLKNEYKYQAVKQIIMDLETK